MESERSGKAFSALINVTLSLTVRISDQKRLSETLQTRYTNCYIIVQIGPCTDVVICGIV